jgi:hypothetical protein
MQGCARRHWLWTWCRVMETRKAVGQSGLARQPLVSDIIIAACSPLCSPHPNVSTQNRAGKHPPQATNTSPRLHLRLCLVIPAAGPPSEMHRFTSSRARESPPAHRVSALHEAVKPCLACRQFQKQTGHSRGGKGVQAPWYAPEKTPRVLVHEAGREAGGLA